MSIAQAILNNEPEAVKYFIEADIDNRDNIDEYGFTPLIETVISANLELALLLLKAGAEVDKLDVTGRTALHWASDSNSLEFCQLLLNYGANPNTYNRGGQPVLAYPILRQNKEMQLLLMRAGASLSFAQDFINAKLLGHRYQLLGCGDIINADGEFIEIDFEGFILEATLAIIEHSLKRFRNHFVARELRSEFSYLDQIIAAYQQAAGLLKYQHFQLDIKQHRPAIHALLQADLLLLPVAYQGHAITFIRYKNYWAKVDRGENSQREGTVNIYHIGNQQALTVDFYEQLLFQRTEKKFVHHGINHLLKLKPILQFPISAQIAGNCSWANVEASVAVIYFLLRMVDSRTVIMDANHPAVREAAEFHQQWHVWDQDRALHECLLAFDEPTTSARKATKAAMLAAVLFQHCKYGDVKSMQRAERILSILTQRDYHYILRSYLETYTQSRFSKRGNNLLHILDDIGVPLPTGVHPITIKK